jgi:hypothetical protein
MLSFFLPGAVVVYLYVKIFRQLRQHQMYMFGQSPNSRKKNDRANAVQRRSLPRVIIEEVTCLSFDKSTYLSTQVRSRRGSRLSQTGGQHSDGSSGAGSPTRHSTPSNSTKSDRSPSQPEIHSIPMQPQR